MISVEHMQELIDRFNSEELDIRDIIEQSYFGGRADAIDDFADYLIKSYDKGMRLSVAMCKDEIEKFKLKALYSRFIVAIDDCVKAFNELEQLKERKNDIK